MTRGGTRYDGSPSRFDHGSIRRLTVDSPHDRGALDQTNRDRSSNWSIIGWLAVDSPRDRDALDQINRDGSSNWSIMGRRRQDVEEPAIALLSLGNRLQSIGRRSTKGQDHDRGPIVARSWPDRGRNHG